MNIVCLEVSYFMEFVCSQWPIILDMRIKIWGFFITAEIIIESTTN